MVAKDAKKEIEKQIKVLRKQNDPLKQNIDKLNGELSKTEDRIKILV